MAPELPTGSPKERGCSTHRLGGLIVSSAVPRRSTGRAPDFEHRSARETRGKAKREIPCVTWAPNSVRNPDRPNFGPAMGSAAGAGAVTPLCVPTQAARGKSQLPDRRSIPLTRAPPTNGARESTAHSVRPGPVGPPPRNLCFRVPGSPACQWILYGDHPTKLKRDRED